jgi:hypothetical protein
MKMRFGEKRVTQFLYATQGVGAVFVSIFLAAYLAGLPSTDVLHSEPAFRIPLIVFGAAFSVMILATAIVAALRKENLKCTLLSQH